MNRFGKRGLAALLAAVVLTGTMPVQLWADTAEVNQEIVLEESVEEVQPEASLIAEEITTEGESTISQEEQQPSVVQEDAVTQGQSQEESGEVELDYIKGRPLTEAEIQAQKDLEPELMTYIEEESFAEPVLGATLYYRSRGAAFPSVYDPRDKGILTSVKNQNPNNTCWSFSSIAMAETSSILGGFGFDANNADFSENHLAYWAYAPTKDPLGNMDGDKNSYTNPALNYLSGGGNYSLAAMTLAQWKGAAAEEVSLSEEDTYNNRAILAEFAEVYTSVDEMKAAILEYRAIGYGFYYDTSAAHTNYQTASYYYPEDHTANHAVTVVGWDDTWKKENFKNGKQPSSDGAWIAKNSYGPKWGKNGYFYISYEDPTLSSSLALRMAAPDTYDHNYQYDGTAVKASLTKPLREGESFANVYEVKGNPDGKEILRAIGFQTVSANNLVDVKIYKNLADKTIPTSGTLACEEKSVSVTYTGYHTIPLSQGVELTPGSYYSIVITAVGVFDMAVEMDSMGSTYKYEADIKEGQSFLKRTSESWKDNFKNGFCSRIKGYTVDVDATATKITLSKTGAKLKKGTSLNLKSNISPLYTTNKSVKWSSSNTKIATVSSSGKVTAKGYGTAVITCTTQDGSNKKATCNVMVGCSITYKLKGGKNNSSNPTVYYNQKVSLKKPTKKGYTFQGWYTSSAYKKKISSIAKGTRKNYTLYARWKKVSVARAATPKLKVSGKGKITVSYKATGGADGYRIYYSTKSNFKNAKSVLTGKKKKAITGLKKGKTYYVRVKAFKKDSTGARIYGKYSAKPKIKITR